MQAVLIDFGYGERTAELGEAVGLIGGAEIEVEDLSGRSTAACPGLDSELRERRPCIDRAVGIEDDGVVGAERGENSAGDRRARRPDIRVRRAGLSIGRS